MLNRKHSNHEAGETLYYFDEHMKQYRPATVFQVIRRYGLIYYVMEVDVGPPINDTFLHMVSEMNVRTENEL